MKALVAIGASCLTIGFAGAAIIAAIRARRQNAIDSEWSLFARCWAGVAGAAGFVAWVQWERILE
ncbi:hypothetical protein [Rathayibacter iranicus]|uniref:Uncharacterized protein n=2 Tax=Rathayibacter iranicus TaxID=59737 RepID=A0AAD1EN66_9MICO|nr:hypothetical protein [Rathayibacter iranicus]AZZ56952.1 hypothetical protein C7V51_14480 [Rathayibacter iranicus]MWV29553.1 hypothetical protein [Rathayibacter iranicus NCPPB 2253 = VKM Ac-1602]PPI41876.1 hypothetical protein C5E09_13335 [Rathayibacter iranicus]PPI57616.1 hypothetical protein C5E08_14235 [Rathayibacter iranicus]PPI68596.1 hypothetical protein C5E01_13290 [Rathayibacter iranicus]